MMALSLRVRKSPKRVGVVLPELLEEPGVSLPELMSSSSSSTLRLGRVFPTGKFLIAYSTEGGGVYCSSSLTGGEGDAIVPNGSRKNSAKNLRH